jgi:hypothetical protein
MIVSDSPKGSPVLFVSQSDMKQVMNMAVVPGGTVIVSDSPKGSPVLDVSQSGVRQVTRVAVETPVTFTCQRDGVHSKPDLNKFIFSHDGGREAEGGQNTWVTTFTSVLKSGEWACEAENGIGSGTSSQSVHVAVEGACTFVLIYTLQL